MSPSPQREAASAAATSSPGCSSSLRLPLPSCTAPGSHSFHTRNVCLVNLAFRQVLSVIWKQKGPLPGTRLLLLQGHFVAAARDRAVPTSGHYELRPTAIALVTLACLICHVAPLGKSGLSSTPTPNEISGNYIHADLRGSREHQVTVPKH